MKKNDSDSWGGGSVLLSTRTRNDEWHGGSKLLMLGILSIKTTTLMVSGCWYTCSFSSVKTKERALENPYYLYVVELVDINNGMLVFSL
jgi:hypothetical protein